MSRGASADDVAPERGEEVTLPNLGLLNLRAAATDATQEEVEKLRKDADAFIVELLQKAELTCPICSLPLVRQVVEMHPGSTDPAKQLHLFHQACAEDLWVSLVENEEPGGGVDQDARKRGLIKECQICKAPSQPAAFDLLELRTLEPRGGAEPADEQVTAEEMEAARKAQVKRQKRELAERRKKRTREGTFEERRAAGRLPPGRQAEEERDSSNYLQQLLARFNDGQGEHERAVGVVLRRILSALAAGYQNNPDEGGGEYIIDEEATVFAARMQELEDLLQTDAWRNTEILIDTLVRGVQGTGSVLWMLQVVLQGEEALLTQEGDLRVSKAFEDRPGQVTLVLKEEFDKAVLEQLEKEVAELNRVGPVQREEDVEVVEPPVRVLWGSDEWEEWSEEKRSAYTNALSIVMRRILQWVATISLEWAKENRDVDQGNPWLEAEEKAAKQFPLNLANFCPETPIEERRNPLPGFGKSRRNVSVQGLEIGVVERKLMYLVTMLGEMVQFYAIQQQIQGLGLPTNPALLNEERRCTVARVAELLYKGGNVVRAALFWMVKGNPSGDQDAEQGGVAGRMQEFYKTPFDPLNNFPAFTWSSPARRGGLDMFMEQGYRRLGLPVGLFEGMEREECGEYIVDFLASFLHAETMGVLAEGKAFEPEAYNELWLPPAWPFAEDFHGSSLVALGLLRPRLHFTEDEAFGIDDPRERAAKQRVEDSVLRGNEEWIDMLAPWELVMNTLGPLDTPVYLREELYNLFRGLLDCERAMRWRSLLDTWPNPETYKLDREAFAHTVALGGDTYSLMETKLNALITKQIECLRANLEGYQDVLHAPDTIRGSTWRISGFPISQKFLWADARAMEMVFTGLLYKRNVSSFGGPGVARREDVIRLLLELRAQQLRGIRTVPMESARRKAATMLYSVAVHYNQNFEFPTFSWHYRPGWRVSIYPKLKWWEGVRSNDRQFDPDYDSMETEILATLHRIFALYVDHRVHRKSFWNVFCRMVAAFGVDFGETPNADVRDAVNQRRAVTMLDLGLAELRKELWRIEPMDDDKHNLISKIARRLTTTDPNSGEALFGRLFVGTPFELHEWMIHRREVQGLRSGFLRDVAPRMALSPARSPFEHIVAHFDWLRKGPVEFRDLELRWRFPLTMPSVIEQKWLQPRDLLGYNKIRERFKRVLKISGAWDPDNVELYYNDGVPHEVVVYNNGPVRLDFSSDLGFTPRPDVGRFRGNEKLEGRIPWVLSDLQVLWRIVHHIETDARTFALRNYDFSARYSPLPPPSPSFDDAGPSVRVAATPTDYVTQDAMGWRFTDRPADVVAFYARYCASGRAVGELVDEAIRIENWEAFRDAEGWTGFLQRTGGVSMAELRMGWRNRLRKWEDEEQVGLQGMVLADALQNRLHLRLENIDHPVLELRNDGTVNGMEVFSVLDGWIASRVDLNLGGYYQGMESEAFVDYSYEGWLAGKMNVAPAVDGDTGFTQDWSAYNVGHRGLFFWTPLFASVMKRHWTQMAALLNHAEVPRFGREQLVDVNTVVWTTYSQAVTVEDFATPWQEWEMKDGRRNLAEGVLIREETAWSCAALMATGPHTEQVAEQVRLHKLREDGRLESLPESVASSYDDGVYQEWERNRTEALDAFFALTRTAHAPSLNRFFLWQTENSLFSNGRRANEVNEKDELFNRLRMTLFMIVAGGFTGHVGFDLFTSKPRMESAVVPYYANYVPDWHIAVLAALIEKGAWVNLRVHPFWELPEWDPEARWYYDRGWAGDEASVIFGDAARIKTLMRSGVSGLTLALKGRYWTVALWLLSLREPSGERKVEVSELDEAIANGARGLGEERDGMPGSDHFQEKIAAIRSQVAEARAAAQAGAGPSAS